MSTTQRLAALASLMAASKRERRDKGPRPYHGVARPGPLSGFSDITQPAEIPMSLDDYQRLTEQTVKEDDGATAEDRITHYIIGLGEEAGEALGKLKRVIRDHRGHFSPETKYKIIHELGDALWYIARAAKELDTPLSIVAELNIAKTQDRKARGVIGGSGDSR